MACREGGDCQTLPLPFQHHSLVILQLGYLLKCGVNIVQCEQCEILYVVTRLMNIESVQKNHSGGFGYYLINVIEEHLTHFIDGDCSIHWTREAEFPHGYRKSSQVVKIRVGEQYCVHLGHHP